MDEKIKIEITRDGRAAIVAFKTALINNVEGIAAVSEQISEFIEENHPDKIVFDFEQVKFFSSQVLGVLLDIRARLKTYDGEVVISAISPQLYRIFEITNLDRIFRFFPDKQNAIREVSANGVS